MRILFAVRLFSGFADSVASGTWMPKGAPTIYRLIETLIDAGHELHLVFVCKEATGPCENPADRRLQLQGLAPAVEVIAGEAAVKRWPRRLRWYVYEARQARKIVSLARRLRPDVVYIDRGNLWAAALTSWLTRFPVVYRMMGVSPALIHAAKGYRPQQLLTRAMLRAPFRLVVCTIDGSGGGGWLQRLLAPATRRVMLLNGVDRASAPPPDVFNGLVPSGRTVVLLVGRLDPLKACDEFLEAFIAACAQRPAALHAVIVGDGQRLGDMQRRARDAGVADQVSFVPALAHRDVIAAYAQADIYVSLNRQGNLSNANLEAFASGCCSIIPRSDPDAGRDVDTDELFPADTALRVSSVDDTAAIARAIVTLHDNPDQRARRRAATQVAARQIPTWRQRMDGELALLEAVAAGDRPGSHCLAG